MAEALRHQPGVASVVGPSVLTGSVAGASSDNPMIAKGGGAVRFALVYDTDPLNASAIGQVRAAGPRGCPHSAGAAWL